MYKVNLRGHPPCGLQGQRIVEMEDHRYGIYLDRCIVPWTWSKEAVLISHKRRQYDRDHGSDEGARIGRRRNEEVSRIDAASETDLLYCEGSPHHPKKRNKRDRSSRDAMLPGPVCTRALVLRRGPNVEAPGCSVRTTMARDGQPSATR